MATPRCPRAARRTRCRRRCTRSRGARRRTPAATSRSRSRCSRSRCWACRRHEVADLLGVEQIADVEHAQARRDERARHDLRIDARRDVAVVRRIPLRGAGRPGVVAGGMMVGGLVDLQAEVRHHERLGLVGDVDDPRGADGVAVAGRAQRPLRVLVELEHVRMTVLGERDRVLRDRRRAPGEPADLPGLGVGVARLDLARVEDQHVARRSGPRCTRGCRRRSRSCRGRGCCPARSRAGASDRSRRSR